MKRIFLVESSNDLYRLFSKTRLQGDNFPALPDGCFIKLEVENLKFRLDGDGSDLFDLGGLSQMDVVEFIESVFDDNKIKLEIKVINT